MKIHNPMQVCQKRTSKPEAVRISQDCSSTYSTWRDSKRLRQAEMTEKSLSIPRLSGVWTYQSPRLSPQDKSQHQRRSPRPNGRNSERRRVFLPDRSVLVLFSIPLPMTGYQDGVQTARRKLKPSTIGSKRTSPSILKLVLIPSQWRSRKKR